MSKQADANEVINHLANQVAKLTTDLAVAQSIISQYQKEDEEVKEDE